MLLFYIFTFILGAIIGSFLNVVICRYNTGESIVYSGSRCLACGKRLTWPELVPVLSFLAQKGRCRECKSRISAQYPLVEFLAGLLFLAAFWKFFPDIPSVIFYWLVFSLLIVISVYDFYHQIIPNKIVYLLGALAFGHWLFADMANPAVFISGLAFFAFFASFWLVSRGRWMGLGDAKLALAAGWLLGPSIGLIAMLFSFWIGAIIGVFLLLFSLKNLTLKSRIPFGPFLSLGMTIAILFGGNILRFYLGFLFS